MLFVSRMQGGKKISNLSSISHRPEAFSVTVGSMNNGLNDSVLLMKTWPTYLDFLMINSGVRYVIKCRQPQLIIFSL